MNLEPLVLRVKVAPAGLAGSLPAEVLSRDKLLHLLYLQYACTRSAAWARRSTAGRWPRGPAGGWARPHTAASTRSCQASTRCQYPVTG